MTTYHMEGLGPLRRVQRRGREGPFALDVQLGAVEDVTPEGCWTRAMTDVVLERLPPDVETLWRLGFVELGVVMKEVVRRARGFVPTNLHKWWHRSWYGNLETDVLVGDRPGGRLVLVDLVVLTESRGFDHDGVWRLGRVSTLSSFARLCGALVELKLPARMDSGSFAWLRADHAEDWLVMGLDVRDVKVTVP